MRQCGPYVDRIVGSSRDVQASPQLQEMRVRVLFSLTDLDPVGSKPRGENNTNTQDSG